MDDVNTLLAFKKLAEDSENSSVLLEDKTSLQGLVLLLSNTDKNIVGIVLQIFSILCEKPGALLVLKSLVGFDQQLTSLIATSSPTDQDKTIFNLAESLYKSLWKNGSEKLPCIPQLSSPTFRPRNIVLRLYGVSSEKDLEEVRERLLKVRGVVSITFQLAKRRVIVCTVPDLDPELLVRAVRPVETEQRSISSEADSRPLSDARDPLEEPIRARIVRKRSQLTRTGSFYRSKSRRYPRRPELNRENVEMPVYLDAGADLFEVDETRAAPKLKTTTGWDDQEGGQGPIDWLSNFLQRSFFW